MTGARSRDVETLDVAGDVDVKWEAQDGIGRVAKDFGRTSLRGWQHGQHGGDAGRDGSDYVEQ